MKRFHHQFIVVLSLLVLGLGCAGMMEMAGGPTSITEARDQDLYAVHFLGDREGFAVGAGGVILHTSDGGESWVLELSGTSDTLQDIGFDKDNPSNGWIVGSNGTILMSPNRGVSWIRQISGTTQNLHAVTVRYNSDQKIRQFLIWAVGDNGTILHSNNSGLSWLPQTSTTMNHLRDIYMESLTTGWAVGDGGAIVSTTDGGSLWQPQVSGTNRNLHSVFFVGSSGWAVGDGGAVLHLEPDQQIWAPRMTTASGMLTDVFFADADCGWAVGERGQFFQTAKSAGPAGSLWIPRETRTPVNLNAVFFLFPTPPIPACRYVGWAVGDRATIIHTVDGGGFWQQQLIQ